MKNYIPLTMKIAQITGKTNEKPFVAVKVSILKSHSATQSSRMVPVFSMPKPVLGQESKLLSFLLYMIDGPFHPKSTALPAMPVLSPLHLQSSFLIQSKCMKFLKYEIKSSPIPFYQIWK